jgi:hypothetical protein
LGVSPDVEAGICIVVSRSRVAARILEHSVHTGSAPPLEASMKSLICATLFGLSLSGVAARGQCAKPEMNPVWDSNQQQFRCAAPADSKDKIRDDSVSPKGDKEFCTNARDNLLKACPSSDDGKACRSKAKSIFNSCYKDAKGQSQAGSASANSTTRTDSAVCAQAYIQQQQACQARKAPPVAPGQPYVPDTCLQDAQTAQNRCLANNH